MLRPLCLYSDFSLSYPLGMRQELINAVPIPSLLIGANERILAANEGARRLWGDRLVTRHYVTVMRQPVLLDAIEAAFRLGRPTETRVLWSAAPRNTTWQATVSPVDDDGARLVLVCLQDRTELQEAGQIRRDFVANVSHELRTPLTALMGFIETLRGAARNDAEARDRFLSIMEREASRMNRLVHDLLSLSRVEVDERLRPTERVDVAASLTGVISTLRSMAEQADVDLKTQGLDSEVLAPGDPDQLSQVFTNLIENAIKYSGQGSVVQVALRRDEQNATLRAPAVVVSVADTGDGIDPIHIPRLTERFYRVDTHRSRELGGTGLGLAIVKHIVNRHRGRLKIESAPGKGSRFTVTLPTA